MRILIADDHALFRDSLRSLLESHDIEVVGEAKNGKEAIDLSWDCKPDVILIGTGSELSLCVEAYQQLTSEGVKARVVSMPCWELFDAQPAEYRDSVLPPEVTPRVAVEVERTGSRE